MSDLSDGLAAIKKALVDAERNMLAEYDRVLEAIDADGVVDKDEEKLEARVTDQLLAFFGLKKAILIAIEQLQVQDPALIELLPQLYASIETLKKADSDLTRILSVQKRINQALGIVIKLASKFAVPLA